jgi:3-hydroxyacyl-CoA dehydrogenase
MAKRIGFIGAGLMGHGIFHIGPVGSGHRLKLINNF